MDLHTQRHGRVADFDEQAGYGHLAEDPADRDGGEGRQWWFHCTAIADGSRRIALDTPVRFRLRPGHLGRLEAVDVTPVDGPTADGSNGAASQYG